ncbi:hypothetical protein jhhlp_008390 [Lomentospora prolificans]|uniref:Calcineurin-like phosphoesterase domain-containing protein n=1 Tax=Lomentospora prolificans TaxID=41688 RepID=A0A2N3MXX3_9PEZI|nr:hypothetical protein jhhlp_008390 [Lomentospora prolificans]
MTAFLSKLKSTPGMKNKPIEASSTKFTATFQYMSDLHLELGWQYTTFDFPVMAPYLILAGDIGCLLGYEDYLEFLSRQTARFELVFLVLGNHEFYGLEYKSAIALAKRLEKEPRLKGKMHLLHRKRFNISNGNIVILGCTMWSQVPENHMEAVRIRVKDFKRIHNWTVEKHNETHEEDLRWLKAEIDNLRSEASKEKGVEKIVVVVTHHAPSILKTSRPEQVANPWTSAFATDILESGAWYPVTHWIYGHTHYSTEFTKAAVKVVSNQRGYVFPGKDSEVNGKEEGLDHRFNPSKTIHAIIDAQ